MKDMTPSVTLSDTVTTGNFNSPPASNGFHIFWEVIENDTAVVPVGVTVDFKVVLPKGTEIQFDGSPFDASVNQLPVTSSLGGVEIKVEATGLVAGQTLAVYSGGIY